MQIHAGWFRHRMLGGAVLLIAALILVIRPAMTFAADAAIGDFEAQADVGVVDPPGVAEFDKATGQYRISAAGENIWAKHDDFHFVYRKHSGDLVMTAEVALVGEGKNAHRKAGLMVRQSLDPDAAYVDVVVHGDGLIALQYRGAKGELTKDVKSTVKAPATLRLERKGDLFSIQVTSKDQKPDKPGDAEGLQWTGTMEVALKDPVFAGLAVSAHDTKTTETAVFSNVVFRK